LSGDLGMPSQQRHAVICTRLGHCFYTSCIYRKIQTEKFLTAAILLFVSFSEVHE